MHVNKLTWLLFSLLLLFGCSANYHVKKAREKCPECFTSDTTITNVVQVKRDTIIKLDTMIRVFLPADTVTINKLIPISRNFDKIIKKQGIITTEVEAVKGMLKVNSYLDSSFIYNLQAEIRIKDAKITTLKEKIIQNEIVIDKQISWLKWLKIGLISIIVLFVLFIIFKFLNLLK